MKARGRKPPPTRGRLADHPVRVPAPAESCAPGFLYFDTEDDSKELLAAGRSGFDKTVTQLAALGDTDATQFYGDRVDVFLDWLEDQPQKIIYAHNCKYDLGNLFADTLDALDVRMVGSRLTRARWHGKQFLDSYNIWPMALKKLGKAFALRKLEFDSHGKDYVFRDVQIVRAAMQFAQQFARRHGLDYLPATLGGLAVKLYQRAGLVNEFDCAMISREALYGGRVELFHTGGSGNILNTDVNSLYPWAMTKMFPSEPDTVRRCTFKGWGVADVTITTADNWLAPLPVRRADGSIYYPLGTVRGVWTFHEITHALDHGGRLRKVHRAYGSTRAEKFYAPFIEKFYKARQQAQTPPEKLMLKLLLNNLYGQLAVSGLITRSVDVANPKYDGIPYGKKKLVDTYVPLPVHCNWLHAAYVTSYGRLKLMEFLRAVGRDRLIYCDTDSAIFWWPPRARLPFTLGDDLGQMKLVSREKICEVFAPKTYRVGRKYKAKGVPSRLARVFIRDGEVSFDAPFQLREAITFYNRDTKADFDKLAIALFGGENFGKVSLLRVRATARKFSLRTQNSEQAAINRDTILCRKKACEALGVDFDHFDPTEHYNQLAEYFEHLTGETVFKPKGRLSVWRTVKKQRRTGYDKKVLTAGRFDPINLDVTHRTTRRARHRRKGTKSHGIQKGQHVRAHGVSGGQQTGQRKTASGRRRSKKFHRVSHGGKARRKKGQAR